MASAAERTSYSWNCRSRRKADATVSFLLISAALGSCCRGAPWTLLSSSGFVTSGRCDSGGAACCEDCAAADFRAMEVAPSKTAASTSGEKYKASRRDGYIEPSFVRSLSLDEDTVTHTRPACCELARRVGRFRAWGRALTVRFRSRARGGTAGGGHDGLIAAGRGFAHRFQSLGVGHQRRGLAVAQGTAGGERQGDRGGGNVVRHLGDEHSVILPESEVGVLYLSTELLNRRPNRVKAILRIGNEPRKCFRRVTYLMKKKRHGRPPCLKRPQSGRHGE